MRQLIRGIAVLATMSGAFAQSSEVLETRTRFGTLTLDKERMLVFNGQRLEPSIQVNSGMDMGTPFHIGATDVVLVINFGGACSPAQYYFVSATKTGAKATPPFGTCNDEKSVMRNGDSILVTMHGYRGPFEPEADRRKAACETHVFVFRDGIVTERGRPNR